MFIVIGILMNNQLIHHLFKRNLSVVSNLRPFLKNHKKNKTFWYFHGSNQFKEMTFRNEKCHQNSSEDNKLRKQLSDSIITKQCNLSHIVLQEFPLKTKLFVLDALSVIHGSDHKDTTDFLDNLLPQIIFELQKQNVYVLIHLLYLSSIIKTENKNDLNFLLSKITVKIEEIFSDEDLTREKFCSEDIAVICHSLFRLRIKLRSKTSLTTIVNTVYKDIINNRLNKAYVLSIVKYWRLLEIYDQRSVEAINQFISNNSNNMSLTECAHYLAFYANFSHYEPTIFSLLAERTHQFLNDSQTSFRTKDLARFLWSMSSVNHKLEEETIELIVKRIETMIDTDFVKYPHFLIDCFKSLIILGTYPSQLLVRVFDSTKWHKILSNAERNKVAKDIYFILESVAIERPDIIFKRKSLLYSLSRELKHNANQELKERIQLAKYLKLMTSDAMNAHLKEKPRIEHCLPHIGIASIVFKEISFEIIDPTVTLTNDSRHIKGLMATKIRQMLRKNIAHNLIYVYNDTKLNLSSD